MCIYIYVYLYIDMFGCIITNNIDVYTHLNIYTYSYIHCLITEIFVIYIYI